jgi:hypothetical protein
MGGCRLSARTAHPRGESAEVIGPQRYAPLLTALGDTEMECADRRLGRRHRTAGLAPDIDVDAPPEPRF